MKRTVLTAAIIGLLLFTGVIVWQGAAEIAGALAVAGWGLLAVAAWHLIPMALDTWAWRLLFSSQSPGFMRLLWARWLGESINGLLPVAQIGGDVAKVRLLALRGVASTTAGATVVVDTTLAMATQVLFALLGVVLLLVHFGQHQLVPFLFLGIAAGAASAAWFYHLQNKGLFTLLAGLLKKITGGADWLKLVGGAQALDEAIASIYQHRGIVLRSAAWRLAGWLTGAGEVWLALYFLGSPVSWDEALLIEALGQAIRGAAFIIPAALGVQEGGYLILGTLLGLSPDVSLALALSKRVRELLLGLPGLLVWQWAEGRQLRERRRKPCEADI